MILKKTKKIMNKIKKFDDFSKLNEGAYSDYQKAVMYLKKVSETDNDGNLKVCNIDNNRLVSEIKKFLEKII